MQVENEGLIDMSYCETVSNSYNKYVIFSSIESVLLLYKNYMKRNFEIV